MPGLNEEKNLASAVENVVHCFGAMKIEGQIVLVNDGSSDRTGEIAEQLSRTYPFIKVLHHETPRGIGGSFWDGTKESEGEIVTMLPGDGENDAVEILRYLPLMEDVDIVIPYVFNTKVRSWKRRMLSDLYRAIINASFGTMLNYMNGTVMYRKCILKNIILRGKGFFYQTELLVKCIRKGYLFAEVPCALNMRTGGKSKAISLKSLKNVINSYFKTLSDVYLAKEENRQLAPDSVTSRRWKSALSGKGDL